MRTNIRLLQADIDLIRSKADQEGMPYQTLISSIVHKYATGQLVDRSVLSELKRLVVIEKQKEKEAL